MATYTVTDRKTGEVFDFVWDGPVPPTQKEIAQIRTVKQSRGETKLTKSTKYPSPMREEPTEEVPAEAPAVAGPKKRDWRKIAAETFAGASEMTGLTVGEALGGGKLSPLSIASGATGYTAGKKIGDVGRVVLGQPVPGFVEGITETPSLMARGAAMTTLGAGVGSAVGYGAKKVGEVGGHIIGRLSTTGSAAVAKAYERSSEYMAARTGKLKGMDIVNEFSHLVNRIKDRAQQEYQTELVKLAGVDQTLSLNAVRRVVQDLSAPTKFNILRDKTGKIITERITAHGPIKREIASIVQKIDNWGQYPGDLTPLGLDRLKRELDGFFTKSLKTKESEYFAKQVKEAVIDTVTNVVPEYRGMLKNYERRMGMLRELNSAVGQHSKGLIDRVKADRILRRLMVTMKKDPELGVDMLDELGKEGAAKLSERMAGYVMRSWTPVGPLGSGPLIIGGMGMFNVLPGFVAYPLLMTASPRIAGKFVQSLGLMSKVAGPATPIVAKYGAYQAAKQRHAGYVAGKLAELPAAVEESAQKPSIYEQVTPKESLTPW